MTLSAQIDEAIKEKHTKLQELQEANKVVYSTSNNRDRPARIKNHISSKEIENLQNFTKLEKLFHKLIEAVKLEGHDDAKLGFLLIKKYAKLDKLLDAIYSHNIFQGRCRASIDWYIFPKQTRYYKPNDIIPKENQARINLIDKIKATENDDEIVTNDHRFPERNVTTENEDDDANCNEKAQCTLDVSIKLKETYKYTMPKITLMKLARSCFKNASTLVHIECESTSQTSPIYVAGRVYFNMEYHEQQPNGQAILSSYITLVDEYYGDQNILLHHFVSRIVAIMTGSPTDRDLPRFIFFASPSKRMLALYPCDLKLTFNDTTYCGLSLKDFKAIITYDKPFFKAYTREYKGQSINFFLIHRNQIALDFSDLHRDDANNICSVTYLVKKFGDVTVHANSQEELCEQLDIFSTINGDLLKKKLETYNSTSNEEARTKKVTLNVDGQGENNQCVYNALKCAIHGLNIAKVKQLPPPSSSMAYTSSKKGLAGNTAYKICKQLGFHLQYLLNSVTPKQRLNAVLENSSEVADKMLLVSLEIADTSHSHCICIDLRDAVPKIVIDCETTEALTQQNLNKQCGDGLDVSGLCFILWIYEGSKPKRGRKYKKKTSNKKSKAK